MAGMPGSDPSVVAQALTKTYEVPVRSAGLRAAMRALVHRETKPVHAVADVSFVIEPGEVVGFLGPNGAGKTTTIKMLAGLLHPSSGQARVLGHEPFKREREYLSRVSLIMGNRNQLQWDLPALDSFELQRAIYRTPEADHISLRDEMIDLLEVGALVGQPVRNLSLGERMKMEIIGALLHRPDVLFLDEPTIGLDVTMQQRIRTFIGDYNRSYGATVLLTSHYMADVEALCKRVIIIHEGRLLFDGALSELSHRVAAIKTIRVRFVNGEERVLKVERSTIAAATAELLAANDVDDLTIEDPPIDDVIAAVFAAGHT